MKGTEVSFLFLISFIAAVCILAAIIIFSRFLKKAVPLVLWGMALFISFFIFGIPGLIQEMFRRIFHSIFAKNQMKGGEI